MNLTKEITGLSRYANIRWEVITNKVLTINDLIEIQTNEGYAPTGYNFFAPSKHLRTFRSGKQDYRYTWLSFAHSD